MIELHLGFPNSIHNASIVQFACTQPNKSLGFWALVVARGHFRLCDIHSDYFLPIDAEIRMRQNRRRNGLSWIESTYGVSRFLELLFSVSSFQSQLAPIHGKCHLLMMAPVVVICRNRNKNELNECVQCCSIVTISILPSTTFSPLKDSLKTLYHHQKTKYVSKENIAVL